MPPASSDEWLRKLFSVMQVIDALASRGDGLDAPLDDECRQIALSFRTALFRTVLETRCAGHGIGVDLETVVGLFDQVEELEASLPAGLQEHSRVLRRVLANRVGQHPGQALLAKRMTRALPAALPPRPTMPARPHLAERVATAPAPVARPASVPPSSPPLPPRPKAPEPPEPPVLTDAFMFGPASTPAPAPKDAPLDPPPPASTEPTLTGQEAQTEPKPSESQPA